MKYRAALLVALSLGLTSVAEARSQRVDQIPNGDEYSCTTCHLSTFPTGPQDAERNAFGEQVEANLVGSGDMASMEVDWQAVYDLDADGDGYTNGEELGDPDGEWSQGEEAPRSYDPSHPADASSTQCDNLDLPQAQACPSDDVGPGADAGADAGSTDNSGGGSEEGCSATGTAAPGSTGALAVLLGLGLAALRRRFSN